MFLILMLALLSQGTYANYAEFFGSSASTSSIGNQCNFDIDDPSNNYYIPALLAYSKRVTSSLSASSVDTDFEPITNIQISNSTNSSTSEVGDINTDYKTAKLNQIHLSLPVAKPFYGSIGLTFIGPLGNFMETSSGDPIAPEYIMYKSRYKRTLIHLNYAYPVTDHFAFSIGTHLGFQASASVETQVSLNGASYGSSGQSETKFSPSLAAILSFLYKDNKSLTYFTYQQEMKSNLAADASGEINDPTSLLFNITLESMVYYDPHILRLSYSRKFNSFSLFLTGEYQLWSKFSPPKVTIRDNGGVILPSSNYEKVETKNIFVPKIGMRYEFLDNHFLSLGALYKPTPIVGDFSESGNSIDTDSTVGAFGYGYKNKFFGADLAFNLFSQYHKLKGKNVVKKDGQENGASGTRIGGPGYKIGGSVFVIGMGLNFKI